MESTTASASYSLQKPEWLVFLCTLCTFAEGTADLVPGIPYAAAAACVATVLDDPQRRMAAMGGRDGMLRSLGSVYSGSVIRFLGGFRGGVSRVIATPGLQSSSNGVALTRDGSTLLVSDTRSNALHMFSVHTGAFLRTIGGFGNGPLQFSQPLQVCVASDGFVFVADASNDRIQILTPQYDFCALLGDGQLYHPNGVCANDNVVIVCELYSSRVIVFDRQTKTRIRRFRSTSKWSYLRAPCFLTGHRHFAITSAHRCVTVLALEGEIAKYHHVGKGELNCPKGVACSDANELVVADVVRRRIVVFSASGDVVWRSEAGEFTGVAMHGSTIFGQTRNGKCVVFS